VHSALGIVDAIGTLTCVMISTRYPSMTSALALEPTSTSEDLLGGRGDFSSQSAAVGERGC
jgi:hypothetical protein